MQRKNLIPFLGGGWQSPVACICRRVATPSGRKSESGSYARGCYVFSLDPRHPEAKAYTRFFNPSVGIWEGPATGSAAGPLACYLVAHGDAVPGPTILIEQGTAMGRTSLIRAEVTETAVTVSGRDVTVASGKLML